MFKRSRILYGSTLLICIWVLFFLINPLRPETVIQGSKYNNKDDTKLSDAVKPALPAQNISTIHVAPAQRDEMFCAIINPSTGSYVDLSQLSNTPNTPKIRQQSRVNKSPASWLVRGWQYGYNFTLSICSSPINDSSSFNTTGAYYMDNDEMISIGKYNTTPAYTGKKLTLAYTDGDLCPNGIDHKASLLNFVCDRDIQTKAQVNFVGAINNCSYFFEVLSIHACPTSYKKNDINVLGIFAGILLVFFAVEYGRRWFYRRMSGRLRRIPNDYLAIPESARPRWAAVDSEPSWRTFLRSCFARASEPHTLINLNTANQPHEAPGGATRQSSVPSSSSLFREIEAQNNLLDSLEVQSSDS
ncbi:HBL122Wp [Eremothecium sinecaudum]|uniref:HBL122Wp n=1 Tax=Eremothecium sinecaudum TaxID=45286 RepID=A0A120K0X4_9SACH|nr:HBL122Wp [Eremothecium sinecaudum]AMD18780.1 HBL122Wp [Eremothecium sinecaudum]